jgi:hypothetical protein
MANPAYCCHYIVHFRSCSLKCPRGFSFSNIPWHLFLEKRPFASPFSNVAELNEENPIFSRDLCVECRNKYGRTIWFCCFLFSLPLFYDKLLLSRFDSYIQRTTSTTMISFSLKTAVAAGVLAVIASVQITPGSSIGFRENGLFVCYYPYVILIGYSLCTIR